MQQILLPQNYQVPFDLSENAEVNAYILEAGFRIFQTNQKYYEAINNAKLSLSHSELKEEHQRLILSERESHRQETAKLTNEFDKIKFKIQSDHAYALIGYESELNELKTKISNKNITDKLEIETKTHDIELYFENEKKKIEEEKDTQLNLYKQRIDQETKRTDEYQNKLHQVHMSLIDREKEMRVAIEKEYQETIKLERERYNALSLQHTNLISSLTPVPSKQTTIVEIGNVGEEIIEKWTRELFIGVEIINTSQQTAKGDLHIRLQNKLFLIEIKNKLNICRTDIDKFIRDIDENKSDIHGGLFISLGSPSIPNKGDFSLEYVGEIPVIYAHVSDKQTLKVLLKTLMVLNNKTDNTSLTMTINQTFTNLKAISSASVSMSKSLDDARTNLDSIKREIKNGLQLLDQLFSENPELKFEASVSNTEYRAEEIKILRETYFKNKKAKMDDYVKALNVTAKYLQDRGGAAKIKSIVSNLGPSVLNFTPVVFELH